MTTLIMFFRLLLGIVFLIWGGLIRKEGFGPFLIYWVAGIFLFISSFLLIRNDKNEKSERPRMSREHLIGSLILIIFYATSAAIFEETLFRGILYEHIAKYLGPWVSLVVTTTIFTLGHIDRLFHEKWIRTQKTSYFFNIALSGLVYQVIYMSFGIWPGIILHFLQDSALLLRSFIRK